jgi:hypothetical protein
LLVQNFVAIVAPLFKATAAASAGPLDEALWYTADWDFWLKLSASGKTIYHPELLSSFRVHQGSQTMNRIEGIEFQLEAVLGRHLSRWEGLLPEMAAISRAGRFSVDVNVALFRFASGDPSNVLRLLRRFVMLGPSCWRRYFRDSRIIERVACRMRAGVLARLERPVTEAPELPSAGPNRECRNQISE